MLLCIDARAVCVRVLMCIRSGGIFVYLYMYVARQCMRVIVNLFYTRAYIRNCAADACLLQRMRVFVCVQRPEWKTTKEYTNVQFSRFIICTSSIPHDDRDAVREPREPRVFIAHHEAAAAQRPRRVCAALKFAEGRLTVLLFCVFAWLLLHI